MRNMMKGHLRQWRLACPPELATLAIMDSLHGVYANWADEPLHGNRDLPERVHLLGDVGRNAGDRNTGKTRARTTSVSIAFSARANVAGSLAPRRAQVSDCEWPRAR
jgi:hypothetical protein